MINTNYEVSDFTTTIKLEPRLIEYIKKKKFNREHNIKDNLTEKEYNIDKNDIVKIKSYLNGKKMSKEQMNLHSDYIKPEIRDFESSELKNDPRFERIKKKQERDRQAISQKENYGIMAKKYDMYYNGNNFSSAYGDDFKSRFNPRVWFEDPKKADVSGYENKDENFINPNIEQVVDMRRRYDGPNIYKNKKPQIRYDDYMTRGCNEDLASNNYSLDAIIGKLNTYSNKMNKYENQTRDYIDTDTKVCIPGGQCNNLREQENNYKPVPYMNGSKQKDVNVENYLCYGYGPSRGKKSLGYPNPAEHYFQYISEDISNPDHTVFEPGMPSRLFNKDTARQYKERDIMM